MELEDDQPVSSKPRGITIITPDAFATESTQTTSIDSTTPPLWRSKEFYVYYVTAAFVIPYMIWVPISLSSSTHPEYFRLFRDNAVLIFVLMVVYALLSSMVRWLAHVTRIPHVTARTAFLFITGIVFVTALHGVNVLKMLALAGINYGLVRAAPWVPRRVITTLIWAMNGGALFLAFYTEGIPWHMLSPSLAWLDEYSGLIRRWHISYNFTMLRMVSFALDAVWAQAGYAPDRPALTPAQQRVRQSRPVQEYTMLAQLVYLWYPPLFIAGPIMTFNDFQSQRVQPLQVPWRSVAIYMLRCAVALLSIEFMMHYMYVNAMKMAHTWMGYTPMELAILGFWSLEFVWLKLVVPWRVFRCWALLDGVDAPENMIRAITNSPSALLFWRAWHRSYNLWVVRYIYIPLGGTQRQILASLVVFTFVALWHDLSFTLLAWAWLIVLFIVPEVLGRTLVPASKYQHTPWFRHVRALGTVANVFMMMSANLVGFVVGLDGVQYVWSQLLGTRKGWVCIAELIGVLFIGAQLMWEYRAEEKRRGIVRNC
ncbi:glycerol transporter [Malassezia pachydermatis]|uniref:Glycerol transporter n=1 Tax=Malassezia pachydermatis TaxID=77020 RepID=A0A0M9VPC7_9BASI|nr:glycerol transporter [Malassezia pachydermatis]KOS14105.1 glycerol transporter [Malassezia pachydermatis]